VRDAFGIVTADAPRVAGACGLLVVVGLTTGATADAAARVLLAAGARRVEVFALARAES
jgi:predicted amidophosphoribosyltransferase